MVSGHVKDVLYIKRVMVDSDAWRTIALPTKLKVWMDSASLVVINIHLHKMEDLVLQKLIHLQISQTLFNNLRVAQDKLVKTTVHVRLVKNTRDNLTHTILKQEVGKIDVLQINVTRKTDTSSTQMEPVSNAHMDGIYQAVESIASILKIRNKTWYLPWNQSLLCTWRPLIMPKPWSAISSKRKCPSTTNGIAKDAPCIRKVTVS